MIRIPRDEFSADEWAAMLGMPAPNLETRVNEVIDESLRIIESNLDVTLTRPKVVYDLKGQTAGIAMSNNVIRLNIDILNDPKHTEDMLSQTIPHEVAHIAEYQLYGAGSHGHRWKHLMYVLGKEPRRCHSYATTKARKHKPKTNRYECDCQVHMVSDLLHKRIQSGRAYKCKECGGRLR